MLYRQLLKIYALVAVVAMACNPRHRAPENRSLGLAESEIIIGMTAPTTGHASFLGTQTSRGALAWFGEVNGKGGISGRKIKLIVRDDAYDPPRTAANVQSLLVEDNAFALFGFVGTPTSVKALPLIERARVPALGFFTGAESLRVPQSAWAFHVRDSYYAETEAAVSYFVDKLGLQSLAVLYQEDAFGQAVLSGVQLALKRRNKVPSSTASFARGTMALEAPLAQLRKFNPDAYFMVGTYSPLARFVKLACADGRHPWFHTVSFVGTEAFARELTESQKMEAAEFGHIVVTQVVPSPHEEQLPAVREFRTLFAKYFPADVPNYVALEGFLNAKILTLALERSGPNPDRDRLVLAIENLKNLDVGIGRNVSYSKNDHVGLSGVFLSKLTLDGSFHTFQP